MSTWCTFSDSKRGAQCPRKIRRSDYRSRATGDRYREAKHAISGLPSHLLELENIEDLPRTGLTADTRLLAANITSGFRLNGTVDGFMVGSERFDGLDL